MHSGLDKDGRGRSVLSSLSRSASLCSRSCSPRVPLLCTLHGASRFGASRLHSSLPSNLPTIRDTPGLPADPAVGDSGEGGGAPRAAPPPALVSAFYRTRSATCAASVPQLLPFWSPPPPPQSPQPLSAPSPPLSRLAAPRPRRRQLRMASSALSSKPTKSPGREGAAGVRARRVHDMGGEIGGSGGGSDFGRKLASGLGPLGPARPRCEAQRGVGIGMAILLKGSERSDADSEVRRNASREWRDHISPHLCRLLGFEKFVATRISAVAHGGRP